MLERKPRGVLASALSGPDSAPRGPQGYRVHRANAGERRRDADPKKQHESCRPHFSHAKCLFQGEVWRASRSTHGAEIFCEQKLAREIEFLRSNFNFGDLLEER